MLTLEPKLPCADLRSGSRSDLLTLSCGTDNLGNTFLLDRLLTTKYPLGVNLMEVAHQCRRKGLALRAKWVPRLENQEANALTNLELKSFDAKKRLNVDLERLDFGVLRQLLDVGDSYVKELSELKTQAKARAGVREVRKRKLAGESLRERDPW